MTSNDLRSDTIDTGAPLDHRTSLNALPWWKGAVIYQIYPRSFLDTNGDGIGDLCGIIEKLPYVAALGVDGVWLSPFFTSPMEDFGYDIADYCDVDPMFGTLSDFDRLIEVAHGLGLKVIIDQVYSHTSDQHPWFQQSRKDKQNAKSDWYVWADPKPDGTPPTNWQSVFGGPSWEWDNRRGQYYLHNFLVSQPDLNLFHPEVQAELLNVTRFWLDRGVDGFRLDALNFGMHDPQLRDNPQAATFHRPPTRPFDFQHHLYNRSHPDMPSFLERIRDVLDSYEDRFTVAEVVGDESIAEMKSFTQGPHRLHSAYSFDYLYAKELTADRVISSSSDWDGTPGEGWPSWAFSNHDAPRAVSRWSDGLDTDRHARMHAVLLMALRGNAFIYQGEELGLVQADVPFEALKDPEAIANWPETLGRDGARTPMPWRADDPQAGFSSGRPWLPLDPRHYEQAADQQDKDSASVLNFFRRLIELRQTSMALKVGDMSVVGQSDRAFVLRRTVADETVFGVINLGASSLPLAPFDLPSAAVMLSSDPTIGSDQEPPADIPGVTGVLLRKI